MKLNQVMNTLLQSSTRDGALASVGINGHGIKIYSNSLRTTSDAIYFLGRDVSGKHLYVVTTAPSGNGNIPTQGEMLAPGILGEGMIVWRSPMNHENAVHLREVFPFTRPVLLGVADSFGFGDRLGIANPAHLRALAGSHMRPVLAQQSIRELDRTQRDASAVLDAASWAAFQEGFTTGFGADADHLKTTADIDRYAAAGFTMYTFDPSAHVVNEAAALPAGELNERAKAAHHADLQIDDVLARYANRTFTVADGIALQPSREEILRAYVKYGAVVSHAATLYHHLKTRHADLPSEIELSVDETDIPTTPAEHLFVAGELKRLGITLVSLAPRFIGDFEKGVDYRGDLKEFALEYRRHAGIAQMFGPYKISIHSGSDKFGVYQTIGALRLGNVHVKTAGTSYLEALRTAAMVEPSLVRDILAFASERYEEERKSYHVTGRTDRLPDPKRCSDADLADLFNQHDARQIFHVTFGKVLTTRAANGNYMFRDRLMRCLDAHENVHYDNLIRHFRKHLDPFRA